MKITCSFIEREWAYYLRLYTDASKTATGVGLAVWVPEQKISRVYRIDDVCSVFDGELTAILMALQVLLDLRPCRAVICCDSLTVLKYIKANKLGQTNNVVLDEILYNHTILIQMGYDIRVLWIPGHVGIYDNDIVDRAAKAATELIQPNLTFPLSFTQKSTQYKLKIDRMWQRDWEMGSTGRFTYNICPSIKTERRAISVKSRRDEVVLNRLKLGVCGLPAHMHVITGESPECVICKVNENIEHYLLSCKKYEYERTKMLSRFEQNNKFNADVKSILNPKSNEQLKFLIDYVKSTNLYNKI
jgi:ribonuclease HI